MEREAEERLWEIVDQAEIVLLVTQGGDGFPRMRPMTLLGYEEEGGLWFATSRSSRKVEEMAREGRVSVCFLDLEGGAYAQAFGEGELVDDPDLKAEFWMDEWDEYWDGPGDEDFVLLLVHTQRAEYYLIDEDELWVVEF
ncbi:MAG: pyridoxamine 5'-phosphate oxidase family protein [Candidatus Bipolaricaulaceae bacterium]